MLRKRHYLQNPKTGLFEGSSPDSGEGSGGLRANDSGRSGGGSSATSKPAKGVLDKMDKAVNDLFRKGIDFAGTGVEALGEAGKKTLENIGKAAKAPGAAAKAAMIFKEENDAKQAKADNNTLKPEEDKFYHFKANCRATRLGPGGKAAAKVLSEGKEFFDVKTGRNTRAESADDMKANVAGQHADPAKSCKDAANDYWGKVLKEQNGGKEKTQGKVVSEKKIDLFSTRKKGR